MSDASSQGANPPFSAADIGALAQLYRGELSRSTVARTRLDTTTNWAVATTGIALTATFSTNTASPLPLVLVGLLVAVFLSTEARRYQFFDFWRIRAHILEVYFYGPILRGEGPRTDNSWNQILANSYQNPGFHISWLEAAGRRIRRNYGWIFVIQATSYYCKLLIHPVPIPAIEDLWARASIGPVPGQVVLLAGLLFHSIWIIIAIVTLRSRRGADRERPPRPERDAVLELAQGKLPRPATP
jgi:uncharacterized membrane protein